MTSLPFSNLILFCPVLSWFQNKTEHNRTGNRILQSIDVQFLDSMKKWKKQLYSILNPITSLVLPENFLFSLIRGRTGISVLPRENRKFCSPSGGKVNPLIFELDSKWNKITYLLFIVKSKQNRKFSGNFSYLDLSRLFW